MSELHDCPKCGKKESAWDDKLCGTCETERMEEEEQIQKREREEYCRKHGGFFDQYGNWWEGE